LEVVQTPFGFVFASVVVAPTHKEVAPVIGAPEMELIVSVLVAEFVQPFVVTVYVIVAVPAARPVTTPVALILATVELEVVQTPPGVVLESVMLEPTQPFVPLIAPTVGRAFTVNVAVEADEQPFAVTV
jgi:hypothetical protein